MSAEFDGKNLKEPSFTIPIHTRKSGSLQSFAMAVRNL